MIWTPGDVMMVVFFGVATLLLVVVVLTPVIRALARRLIEIGATRERLRWHEVEMRAEDEMIRRALQGEDDFTETEIDV